MICSVLSIADDMLAEKGLNRLPLKQKSQGFVPINVPRL